MSFWPVKDSRIRIDVHHHDDNGQGQGATLAEIKSLLVELKEQGVFIVATLADYQAQLTRIGTGLDDIVEDIRRIKEALANPGLTDAEEAQLLTELGAVADRVEGLAA